MMKRVMLLLMSLGLPQVPAQLHTHTCASPKSYRPDDSKQPPFILQRRKMCFPHLQSQYRSGGTISFSQTFQKTISPWTWLQHSALSMILQRVLSYRRQDHHGSLYAAPDCKGSVSRNNISCCGYQWAWPFPRLGTLDSDHTLSRGSRKEFHPLSQPLKYFAYWAISRPTSGQVWSLSGLCWGWE